MSNLKTRLVGLAACIALLLLVVGMPVLLVAIGAVPRISSFSLDRLTSPDDGTMAIAVISVVAWIAWLAIATSVALELIARVKGIHAPRLPGLAVPQMTAGRLIAFSALLFISVPVAAQGLTAPQAVATTPPSQTPGPPAALDEVRVEDSDISPASNGPQKSPTTVYTVKRGDSLWKIAQQHLGDGRRYNEIVVLNDGVLNGQPDFITPGTVLRIPTTLPADNGQYVVQPGDTLSEIARAHLGDAAAYPRIFEASKHMAQPDGGRLTDPDLIRPGWRLTVPDRVDDEPGSDEPPQEGHADPPPINPPVQEAPSAPASPESQEETADLDRADSAEPDQDDGTAAPGWILPGLTGGGALLAGSLLLVLRQRRRTQQRYRRPGRIVAPPPPELRTVEKSAHLVGTTTAPKIDVLDRALRHLAVASGVAPRINVVMLTAAEITLHLAESADLPEPWHGERTTWALAVNSDIPDASGEVPPYPLLVSIGQADDGALALVNLEELRSVRVTGAPEMATALGRHIAAELALNPWSMLVEIHTIGIGSELASIDPLRLHHHAVGDTAFLDHLAAELEGKVATNDPDRFHAVLSSAVTDKSIGNVDKIITSLAGRSAAAVVTINSELGPDSTEFHVTTSGRLTANATALDLSAAGLTADEAAACAAIVDLTSEAKEVATPVAETSVDGEEPFVDLAGALRVEVTEPRPSGTAGDRSLLPLSAETYEQNSATTHEDVDNLAPVVPAHVGAKAAEKDPHLDADLSAWADPGSPLPRLTLLGPVDARTNGPAARIAHRKPFYVELLAFLALHPKGVTSPEVCDAFGLKPDRARVDLANVRRWLGTNPRTGDQHLPSARAHQRDDHRGLPIYQVDGVLTDLDLFRRLRTRGQSRGSDGIDDLVAALRLVSGEPFTGLRPAGWSWLLDGDRIDHIMTCAIVDVAHIVTTHALTSEDFDLARLAAETAYAAAPDDETSRLDLIDVAAATGHANLADRQLVDGILNRSDDELGPIDLPTRTARIMRQRGWKPQARPSNR